MTDKEQGQEVTDRTEDKTGKKYKWTKCRLVERIGRGGGVYADGILITMTTSLTSFAVQFYNTLVLQTLTSKQSING